MTFHNTLHMVVGDSLGPDGPNGGSSLGEYILLQGLRCLAGASEIRITGGTTMVE